MKRLLSLFLLVVTLGLTFAAGSWVGSRSAGTSAGAAEPRALLWYTCPMHPAYHSDRPGDCPSCGMRLEPVYREGEEAAAARAKELPEGTLHVETARQQAIGVRVAAAEHLSGVRLLRTTGEVVPRDDAIYPVLVGVEARVRSVGSQTVGSLVRRNELLASLYAPQILPTVQNYLLALNSGGEQGDPVLPVRGTAQVTQRGSDLLRDLGLSEAQIEELRTKRQPTPYIQLAAPADGFVLQRNLLAGQRVEPGEELYRIADLHRVWVMADAYENQLPLLRPGTAARITSGGAGAALVSRVGGAPPVFDRTSRTMKLRLEAGNPGLALKPGMFVDVEFDVTLPPTLAIPSDAIVDSGLRRIVFVDRGQGYFEPREVETGWRIGDRVEVLKGLAPGERIVVSGNFLLDSESRMKSAAAQAQAPAPMAPAAAQAAAPSTAAAPEAAAPTHRAAEHAVPARAKDPVCGMEVDPKEAASAGRTGRHEGRTYYFCSDECRKNFQADPAKYLRPAGGTPHD